MVLEITILPERLRQGLGLDRQCMDKGQHLIDEAD